MKMLAILLTIAFHSLTARGYSQNISLAVKNEGLSTVFKKIEAQSELRFVYSQEAMALSKPVTIHVNNAGTEQVLQLCFSGQPLSYTRNGNFIIVKIESIRKTVSMAAEISGLVVNEQGAPVWGITVRIKGSEQITVTNEKGEFRFSDIKADAILLVSGAEIEPQEVPVSGRNRILIQVSPKINLLDETIIKGYYTTSRKLNTGSVSKISADAISQQPVSNVLAALQGRAPGLLITSSSGIPGSSFQIQVRGQQSIAQGNDPYIIIDGVPFAPNNSNINQVGAAFTFSGNGLSPLSLINPADILSIEILKDADATAIYGSKGSNGVILITTKNGMAGKGKVDLNIYAGFSTITRSIKMMHTRDYVQMRKEAFFNDGVIPTNANAFDILLWDTTRYTDWTKELIGGTAHTQDAQVSVSGGSDQTQFILSNGFHRETTVYPGDMSVIRGSFQVSIQHRSADKKFSLSFKSGFSYGSNNIILSDLAKSINLPPLLPALYDSAGNLKWNEKGFSFSNPLAFLRQTYTAKTENFLANTVLQYKFTPALSFKTSVGYNSIHLNDKGYTPISSRNPASNPTGSAQFGTTAVKGITIEPQLQYVWQTGQLKFDLLAGSSWQQNNSATSYLFASGYTNDALLGSISSAASVNASGTNGEYRYGAVFGRMHINYGDRYLLNLTGRRDGSSRFGPGKQFANFGAVGLGWIFTNEQFFNKHISWLHYGKIRMSFGSAGNDNIGDYQYLDRYGPTSYPYQGIAGLVPSSLFNADYSWEVNRKLELALELAFLKDRVSITTAWFRNRSNNQLIPYNLPSQTGFGNILSNFPALLENSGVEIEMLSKYIKKEKFTWTSSFTISFIRNKLLSFPDLENSSYRNQYLIGSSLNLGNGFQLNGVDPQTGLYTFYDKEGNPTSTPSNPNDLKKGLANLDPTFYGGFQNSLQYKGFELSIFFEFRKQTGYSYLSNFINIPAGTRLNQPVQFLARWQQPGDITSIQRYTTTSSNPAYRAASLIHNFGANNKYADASYCRLKNLSFSYQFSSGLIKQLKLQNLRVYIQGQNLFTFSSYEGGDPETQNALRLPPLRVIAGGIQLTF